MYEDECGEDACWCWGLKGLRKIVSPLLALPKEVSCPFLWHQMPTKHQGPSNSYSVRKEGRKEGRIHGWEENRHALFTIYLEMFNSRAQTSAYKAPLAAAFSPFMSLLYPPNPWCDWHVKVAHTTRVLPPSLFQQWCGFFYVPQEPDKRMCCETGHILIREE